MRRGWWRRLRGLSSRHPRFTLVPWSLALLPACGLVALGWFVWLHPPSSRPEPLQDSFDFSAPLILEPDSASDGRAVYPYSVVPGGVKSPEELREAVARDPVVASHYRNFDLRKAHVVRLHSARAVYVSYRLHNDIFWTSKRLRLPAGEKLITDGVHFARTRCGNRISTLPREKVSPLQPPLPTLETPAPSTINYGGVLPSGSVPTSWSAPPSLSIPPVETEQPVPPLAPPAVSGTPFGGLIIPTGGLLIPACVQPSNTRKRGSAPSNDSPCAPVPPCPPSKTPPGSRTPCNPPVSATPEPGTLLLFLTGAAYLAYRRWASQMGAITPPQSK